MPRLPARPMAAAPRGGLGAPSRRRLPARGAGPWKRTGAHTLWVLATVGFSGMGFVTEGQTLAEGVRVRYPLRAGEIRQVVEAGHGSFVAVDEADILPGRDELAHRGLYVEPTSAIVWNALEQVLQNFPDPVVVMLTGSGYKSAVV